MHEADDWFVWDCCLVDRESLTYLGDKRRGVCEHVCMHAAVCDIKSRSGERN